ncbi:MAG: transporter ATP-binding protein [Conexibacter sp.]|jgi:peptide/nickel transport system ATP-binding protein|nr:transporter ATP-binding protein [Conexibacter sp.]
MSIQLDQSRDLLRVENLRVAFGPPKQRREVVEGVSFTLAAGRCLAIVGESGSGKSVTARSLVGLTGGDAHVSADALAFEGRSLLGLRDRGWRALRGKGVGFVLQDALVSLDQLRPVGKEIAEGLRLHRWGTRETRRARVVELLTQVGVPEPELRARQLPHELSGGLRQRALIAAAIALDPPLIIADEPTTALDVTVQAQVLDLLAQTKERGTALILISHDLAVVARMADEVAVMRAGEIVERGPASEVLARPRHAYTRALLDAVPSTHSKGTRLSPAPPSPLIREPAPAAAAPVRDGARVPVLEATGLVKRYRGPDGITRTVVDDVSFELAAGETLGVVGESGSGKTTTARIALALTEPDGGQVLLNGGPWTAVPERRRRARRRQIGVVYQDPLSSFDPRWSVERILLDALPEGGYPGAAQRRARIGELLEQVGLEHEHRDRRPLQLSGGQRQRVAIARALAPEPSVIVCDEPVSALDVSIQAQVLDLLTDLQAALGLSYLFISHDLGVIHHMSDRVLVLNDGKVVEQGTADEIFFSPRQPYTQQLLAALPTLAREPRDLAEVG